MTSALLAEQLQRLPLPLVDHVAYVEAHAGEIRDRINQPNFRKKYGIHVIAVYNPFYDCDQVPDQDILLRDCSAYMIRHFGPNHEDAELIEALVNGEGLECEAWLLVTEVTADATHRFSFMPFYVGPSEAALSLQPSLEFEPERLAA